MRVTFSSYGSNCSVFLVLFLVIISLNTRAQINYKGIWQGYITAPGAYNSGYTLHIEEYAGDRISGTAYIYRNENPFQFDGILDFIGTVNRAESRITELVIVRQKMPDEYRRLCIKFMSLNFSQKEGLDFLTGPWDGSLADLSPCLPGKVYLRRYNPDDPNGIEPIPDEILTAIKQDNSSKMNFLNTELAKPILINVRSPVLKFEIRDYLRIDQDTVSIYLNRQPLAEKIGIVKKPYSQTFMLDAHSELNEIILYAENLGGVPPNTSNLTIIDGKIKHQLIISSTKQVSAVLYLRYRPDGNFR